MRKETVVGSDNVSINVAVSKAEVTVGYRPRQSGGNSLAIFFALGTHRGIGAAILPFAQNTEGSTVFLPFKSDLLLSAQGRDGQIVGSIRKWECWRWSEREETHEFEISEEKDEFVFRIPRKLLGRAGKVDCAIYAKDLGANDGWGWFWGCSDRSVAAGLGDKYIPHYFELDLDSEREPIITERGRHGSDKARVRIYQLFVRLFGNTNETRKQNGTLTENGVGRFADINAAALSSIRQMGFTHVWLTGVLQQATATDYSEFGQPADDTDLLKGLARERLRDQGLLRCLSGLRPRSGKNGSRNFRS